MSREDFGLPRDYIRVQAVLPFIGNENDLLNQELFRARRQSLANIILRNDLCIGNPSSAILNYFPTGKSAKAHSRIYHSDKHADFLETANLFFYAKIDAPSPEYKEKIKQRKANNETPPTWESIFEETATLYLDPWYLLERQINYTRQQAILKDMEEKKHSNNSIKAIDAEHNAADDRDDARAIDHDRTHVVYFNPRVLRRFACRNLNLLMIMIFMFLAVFHFSGPSIKFAAGGPRTSICSTTEFGYNSTTASIAAFHGPENSTYRAPDTVDTFANYNFRNHKDCQISSLDLHSAFAPLCQTRSDFLRAFSGGGRIGFGAPFMPRDCDMRWFTTEEICEIFSRFEKVIVVGDSMMRHVVGALNVLLRKDLGYGAVTNWNFNDQELKDCFCNHQMDVKSCSVQGIFTTSSVLEHDPTSLACPASNPIDLVIEMMLRFPLDPIEISRLTSLISPTKPTKPYAFVFGHGLWNDLDLQATLNWLDGILSHLVSHAPYLEHSLWPRLFVTPNAAGIRKPDTWIVTQGDKALQIFEESVRVEAGSRGAEHMGTWNMSIQMEKYDGVHLDLKGNLVKAMGVVNWLGLLEVEQW